MEKEILVESDNIDAYWIAEHGVLHVVYKGELIPESTLVAYKTGGELLMKYGEEGFKGIIGDFRLVTKFPNANAVTTRNQSRRYNTQYDLSKLGVAFLTKTMMQESFVKMTAKISNTEHRSKVVASIEDGLTFIAAYRSSDAENPVLDDSLS